MDVGHEQVMAQQHSMRVEQRQRIGEAGSRAIADVHAHVAVGLDDRSNQLAANLWRHGVRIQLDERHVALLQPEPLPGFAPERHRIGGIREVLLLDLGEEFGSETQQAGDQIGQLMRRGVDARRQRISIRPGQDRAGFDLEQVPTDAHDLVRGQVVVDVGDVDQKGIVAQEAERFGRSQRVQGQATDVLGVVRHVLPSQLEHVG